MTSNKSQSGHKDNKHQVVVIDAKQFSNCPHTPSRSLLNSHSHKRLQCARQRNSANPRLAIDFRLISHCRSSGDLCTVSEKRPSALCAVSYPRAVSYIKWSRVGYSHTFVNETTQYYCTAHSYNPAILTTNALRRSCSIAWQKVSFSFFISLSSNLFSSQHICRDRRGLDFLRSPRESPDVRDYGQQSFSCD